MTHKEVMAWVSTVATLLFFALYLTRAPATLTAPELFGLYVQIAVALIVVQIILAVVLSIWRGQERTDERDRAISTKSYRNAYFVVSFGVFLLVLMLAGFASPLPNELKSMPTVTLAVHWLLLNTLASELIRSGSMAFYYRRGA